MQTNFSYSTFLLDYLNTLSLKNFSYKFTSLTSCNRLLRISLLALLNNLASFAFSILPFFFFYSNRLVLSLVNKEVKVRTCFAAIRVNRGEKELARIYGTISPGKRSCAPLSPKPPHLHKPLRLSDSYRTSALCRYKIHITLPNKAEKSMYCQNELKIENGWKKNKDFIILIEKNNKIVYFLKKITFNWKRKKLIFLKIKIKKGKL